MGIGGVLSIEKLQTFVSQIPGLSVGGHKSRYSIPIKGEYPFAF
jgi:hypothetical protein